MADQELIRDGSSTTLMLTYGNDSNLLIEMEDLEEYTCVSLSLIEVQQLIDFLKIYYPEMMK